MVSEQTRRRFAMRLGQKSRPVLLLWGVHKDNSYVDLDATEVDAHFGFFRFSAPVSNIVRWRIEGPWNWITAIGVRRGLRRGDVSFAGTHTGGIRLDFRDRIRWGPFRVPTLYVAVEDLDGFARALVERGIPGEDVRRISR